MSDAFAVIVPPGAVVTPAKQCQHRTRCKRQSAPACRIPVQVRNRQGAIMFGSKRNIGNALFVFVALAISVIVIRAQDFGNGWETSAVEIAKLPDYCQRYFLKKVLPLNWDGVHHLCAGRVMISRATDYFIPKGAPRRLVVYAISELQYVFRRKNPAACLVMDEARATERQTQVPEPLLL